MNLVIVNDTGVLEAVHVPAWSARPTRVLVATRGEPGCDAVLREAAAVAARAGAALEAVTVFVPPVPLPSNGVSMRRHFAGERRDRPAAARLLHRVRRHWRQAVAARPATHHFVAGDPATAIAACARSAAADLVVVGLGRVEPAHRALGSLTAARLAVLADVPVLAVAPDAAALPRRATVHAESPRAALRLVGSAAALLADEARLTVVRLGGEESGWPEEECRQVEAWWRAHGPSGGAPLEWRDPDGAPGRAATELVVMPVPGATEAIRSLMSGRVMRALQSAHCSVLTVPVDVLRASRVPSPPD